MGSTDLTILSAPQTVTFSSVPISVSEKRARLMFEASPPGLRNINVQSAKDQTSSTASGKRE
jgi:hypothetical protein